MKNEEVLQEVMMALHAKDKLDEVVKYLEENKNKSITTKEILEIIEKEDKENDFF